MADFSTDLGYLPLDPSRSEIRLLTPRPSVLHPNTSWSLVTVSLDFSPPPYAALSYVWGDGPKSKKIIVNGQRVLVKNNLDYLLRHVRGILRAHGPRFNGANRESRLLGCGILPANIGRPLHCRKEPLYIWADALCINQGHHNERASQVALMRRVFSSAQLVVAWLGPAMKPCPFRGPRDWGQRSLNTLGAMAREIRKWRANTSSDGGGSTEKKRDHPLSWLLYCPSLYLADRDAHANSSNDILDEGNETLFRLSLFLQHNPYWQRVWAVQEVLLAQDLILACGDVMLPWEDLATVCEFVHEMARERELGKLKQPAWMCESSWRAMTGAQVWLDAWSQAWELEVGRRARREKTGRRVEGAAKQKTDYMLIHRHAGRQASNPKDHIYGLIGVAEANVKVDYTDAKSPAEVYVDFLSSWERDKGEEVLACLEHAGIGCNYGDTTTTSTITSSWVPNWPAISQVRYQQQGILSSRPAHLKGFLTRYKYNSSESYNLGAPPCSILYKTLVIHGVVFGTISYASQVCNDETIDLDTLAIDFLLRQEPRNPAIFRLLSQSSGQAVTTRETFNDMLALLFVAVHQRCRRLGGYCGQMEVKEGLGIGNSVQEFLFPRQDFDFDLTQSHAWLMDDLLSPWKRPEQREDDFARAYKCMQAFRGYRVVELSNGFLAVANRGTEEGDLVCVLQGGTAPCVLRKCDDGEYVHVGICDVLEMQGEKARSQIEGMVSGGAMQRFDIW